MSRLTLTLPEELGKGHDAGGPDSRPLGAGIEGADELTKQLDRWFSCWASSDD